MKNILPHIKTYIFRGLLALIPVALTYLAVRFLYVTIDQRVMGMAVEFIGFSIPGLGLLLVLLVLYFVGVGASNVAGKEILHFIERVTNRVPIIKSTYQIGKQVATSFSLPEKQVFKRAVLVEFLKPGSWTIGFVTGTLTDKKDNDQKLLKVYVPTPPNPTSGFILILKESETRDPGWSIEETMKTVISAGIIGPVEIR